MKTTCRGFDTSDKKGILTQAWPIHLPESCPKCGEGMTPRVNLSKGNSLMASWLINYAPWLAPLVLCALFIAIYLLPPGSIRGNGGSMAFAAMVISPSILVTLFAKSLRKKFRITCHQCGCTHDYPIKKRGRE